MPPEKRTRAYKDFLSQLRDETLAFAGQVVLVHGDSHQQQINQPLRNPNHTGRYCQFHPG
jgi:hypothetical protein